MNGSKYSIKHVFIDMPKKSKIGVEWLGLVKNYCKSGVNYPTRQLGGNGQNGGTSRQVQPRRNRLLRCMIYICT
jgi:hypothetical protein